MNTDERLKALYDRMPKVECKGLCWNACGPIDMSVAERQKITDLGVEIPEWTQERHNAWTHRNENLYCPALSFNAHNGKMGCTVYEARPLICRAWGVGEGDMACPHGCETTGRLSPTELLELLVESFEIGGHPIHEPVEIDEFRETLRDPEIGELFARMMNGDRSVMPELAARLEKRRA